MSRLNPKGIREKKLSESLKKIIDFLKFKKNKRQDEDADKQEDASGALKDNQPSDSLTPLNQKSEFSKLSNDDGTMQVDLTHPL